MRNPDVADAVELPVPRVCTSTGTVRAATRWSRREITRSLSVLTVVAVVGFLVPMVTNGYTTKLLGTGVIAGILAFSVAWLYRHTGILSFGHAAFYGTGAYGVAIAEAEWGLTATRAALFGLAAAAVIALLTALVLAKVPGIAASMLTLAVGQILYTACTRWRSVTGGYDGLLVQFHGNLFGKPADTYAYDATSGWILILAVLIVLLPCMSLVSRTRFGRKLTAARDNQERARFVGFPVFWPRVIAFTVSGTVAGLAGVLSAFTLAVVTPDSLYWSTSGQSLIFAIIGGSGIPAIAVAVGTVLTWLQSQLSGVGHYTLIVGALVMVVVVAAPGGIAGLRELKVFLPSPLRRTPRPTGADDA